jgi:hypothetical protein
VAGVFLVGRRPPGALQPATVTALRGTARRHASPVHVAALTPLDDRDEDSLVMNSLRALGLVRHGIPRPVVGERAYVRLWERSRALVVLAAIIVSIGVAVAATIGIFVLVVGFLLEQAIS